MYKLFIHITVGISFHIPVCVRPALTSVRLDYFCNNHAVTSSVILPRLRLQILKAFLRSPTLVLRERHRQWDNKRKQKHANERTLSKGAIWLQGSYINSRYNLSDFRLVSQSRCIMVCVALYSTSMRKMVPVCLQVFWISTTLTTVKNMRVY